MDRSSTRKNFLDILTDPTTIAIIGSIALHATIGAILPFLTQPDKAATKDGPTIVKVVQLTPNELQRIPQAPQTPQVPTPQVSAKPTAPTRPTATAANTKFSTAPQTIPFSPQRPSDGTIFKPPTPTKKQTAVPQKQPVAPDFDPENVFKPKKTATKPSPQVSPPVKIKPVKKTKPSPTPDLDTATDDNGGDNPPMADPSPNPNSQAQQPPATPKPTPTPTPTTTPTPQPSGTPTGNNGGFYGKYTDAALKQLSSYMTEYGVKDPYPSKTIALNYPQGMLCEKEKQTPFIVLMAVLDKVPENPDEAILGSIKADGLKIKTFTDRDTPQQQKLGEIATKSAIEALKIADSSRPEKDKGKRVIYQYLVKFDPTTCKK